MVTLIDEKLQTWLEERAIAHPGACCIHFQFSAYDTIKQAAEGHRAGIIAIIQKTLEAAPELYFMRNGDLFVVGADMSLRDTAVIIREISALLNIYTIYSLIDVYELDGHVNRLLALLEEKKDRRLSKHEEAQQRLEQEKAGIKSYVSDCISNDMYSEHMAAVRLKRARPEFMIIEEDMFSRRLVEGLLAKQYSLHHLTTPEEALNAYDTLAPDVVFLNITQRGEKAIAALKDIIRRDPKAYVVLLTGYDDMDYIPHAMRAGAAGFIAKPFTRQKLFQHIERCPTLHAGSE